MKLEAVGNKNEKDTLATRQLGIGRNSGGLYIVLGTT